MQNLQVESNYVKDEVIDENFILREDLRDWIFKEDNDGNRYRERIINIIERIGVEKWFKLKGYPTDEKSVWKNRYGGGLRTLGDEIHEYDNEFRIGNLEEKGYYLWENNLPIEIWSDKELREDCKVGTKEYYARLEEQKANDKKYKTKPKAQKNLFDEVEDDFEEQNEEDDDEEVKKIKQESICPVIVLKKKEEKNLGQRIKEKQDKWLEEDKEEYENLTEIEKSRRKLCQEQNEEYFHLTISLNTGTLSEPKLSLGSTHQKPKGQFGSSWGGSYTISNDNKELMDKFLEFFKANAEKPYHPIDGFFTTTLKIENCWVEFSKQAKEFMIKNGFDFNKYEEEVKNITQKIATQEDISKGRTFDLMEKTMDKLKSECWAIKGYFENFLNLNKKCSSTREYHIEKLEKFGIDYSDLNKLKELYEQKAKTYKIYYSKVYEQRWNKKPDEEYSYP